MSLERLSCGCVMILPVHSRRHLLQHSANNCSFLCTLQNTINFPPLVSSPSDSEGQGELTQQTLQWPDPTLLTWDTREQASKTSHVKIFQKAMSSCGADKKAWMCNDRSYDTDFIQASCRNGKCEQTTASLTQMQRNWIRMNARFSSQVIDALPATWNQP